MAPRIISTSWMQRRKSSRSRSRGASEEIRGAPPATSCTEEGGEILNNVSDKSGASDNDNDCNCNSAAAEVSRNDTRNTKSRRRARSAIRKCDQPNSSTDRAVPRAQSSIRKEQHEEYSERIIMERSTTMRRSASAAANDATPAKSCLMTPPRHHDDDDGNTTNERRSRRRNHQSGSDGKYNQPPPPPSPSAILRNRQQQQQHRENSELTSRYSLKSNNSVNSKDDERGGMSTGHDLTSVSPRNNVYQPYRCKNVKNNHHDDNNAVDSSMMYPHDHRTRSTSMPNNNQAIQQKRPSASPLIRKQTYTDDNHNDDDDDINGGKEATMPKKQISFEEQPSSSSYYPRKQLSFQEQLLRQKPLPPHPLQSQQPLSFEEQLLHQEPISMMTTPTTNLSFEEQLLRQHPPPPQTFELPRSLSESLGTGLPSSLSFEQQQQQLLHDNNNIFPNSPHSHNQIQFTSFADATANCDGSSVIYFRNDSGRVSVCERRSMSLPPPVVRWDDDEDGSVGESDDDYSEEDEFSKSDVSGSEEGGMSSQASPDENGPIMPPLSRKTAYNTSMEVPLPPSLHTSPPQSLLSTPPPISMSHNMQPQQFPQPQSGEIITAEEYARLQKESEMVRARMLEIEARIRDIESSRGIPHGGGVGGGGGGYFLDEGKDGTTSCIEWSSSESEGQSDKSYYSDEDEEEDEDTIGDLLSSVSLLKKKKKHRFDGEDEEDENTIGPFLSSTTLTVQPLEEDDDNEEVDESEANIEIQKNMVSVSSLNCEGNSSYASIPTYDNEGDDSSAALTDDGEDDGEETTSTGTTASRRKVRFDDDEQYQSAPVTDSVGLKSLDDPNSRQSQEGKGSLSGYRDKKSNNYWQIGGVGSNGSTESVDSHGSIERSGDSIVSTTSSASNSSGDYHTLKTLLAPPKRHQRRACNHTAISEEDEYCDDCGDIFASATTQPSSNVTATQKKMMTNEPTNSVPSRHVEQPYDPLERKSTYSSTSSTSTISTLLEHAPLEVHLKGIKQRRSKLLELVEAQDQNKKDATTQRSIEFSLFLMKDKLNQLQALGVLGEDGEDQLLKSGGARRLLRKIRSEGANRAEGNDISSYKRSST